MCTTAGQRIGLHYKIKDNYLRRPVGKYLKIKNTERPFNMKILAGSVWLSEGLSTYNNKT
jgi:hypothetical protein